MDRGTGLTIQPAETAATLYLVAPLFVFFAFFVRLEIAIPACVLIAFQIYEIVQRTHWRGSMRFTGLQAYFLGLAGLWVLLSGGIGPLHQNSDWLKHYAVINFLAEHPWPPEVPVGAPEGSALRYYIGWYLIPAAVLKVAGPHLQTIALSMWSTLGVFLFFNLLPELVGKRLAAIGAPLAFMFFSGADLLGQHLTNFTFPRAPPYHFEWWSGWIQYSSSTTSIFWVPQHAIPAWIGVAILMRSRDNASLLPYLGLLFSAAFIWSPFSAIGLAPFIVVLAIRHGIFKVIVDWRILASMLLLALPVAMYLTAGSQMVTKGFIVDLPCTRVCFTWFSYARFLLLEVGLAVVVLLLWPQNERGFVIATTLALCLIPMYKVGFGNDFAMRASLPSLAVVAILCAKVLFAGRWRWSAPVLVVLLAGLPTPIAEMYRAFLDVPTPSPDTEFQWPQPYIAGYYFAPLPVWLLR